MTVRLLPRVWARAFSLCVVAMACSWVLAASDGDAKRRSALQREQARVAKIRAWARKKGASPLQLMALVYEPVAKGNKKQYPKTTRLASRWYKKAEEAQKKREPKKAKLYEALGGLFKAYAKENKKVVEAYKKGDGSAMKLACDQIMKIERKIFELTGRRVDRDWFTPDEMLSAPATAPGTDAGKGGGARAER